MHCSPLIGPRHQSVDEMLRRIPASATLRGPGSNSLLCGCGICRPRAVGAKTQRSHYKRVRVEYVIRLPGSCWRCGACLFCLSFLPEPPLLFSSQRILIRIKLFLDGFLACRVVSGHGVAKHKRDPVIPAAVLAQIPGRRTVR